MSKTTPGPVVSIEKNGHITIMSEGRLGDMKGSIIARIENSVSRRPLNDEDRANAGLIVDAFNAKHATGQSPLALVHERNTMIEAHNDVYMLLADCVERDWAQAQREDRIRADAKRSPNSYIDHEARAEKAEARVKELEAQVSGAVAVSPEAFKRAVDPTVGVADRIVTSPEFRFMLDALADATNSVRADDAVRNVMALLDREVKR